MIDSSHSFFDPSAEALARLLYDEASFDDVFEESLVVGRRQIADVLDFGVYYENKHGSIATLRRGYRLSKLGALQPECGMDEGGPDLIHLKLHRSTALNVKLGLFFEGLNL